VTGQEASIYFGSGGDSPGILAMGSDHRLTSVAELPAGESVYALDAADGRLAAGTRGGSIIVLDPAHGSDERMHLIQGAPLLSICFVDRHRIAAVDGAGRCLLWRVDRPDARPQELESGRGTICSLARLPSGELAGLSADGVLLFWAIGSGRLLRSVDSLRPPSPLGLVSLVYWPARDVLLHPGREGRLAMRRADGVGVAAIQAHEGDFTAAFVTGDHCVTAGSHDGRLKLWNAAGGCEWEFAVPNGVVGGDTLQDDPEEMVLIGTGEAIICTREGADLSVVHREKGQALRVAAGLPPEMRKQRTLDQRAAVAHQTRGRIATALQTGRFEEAGRDIEHLEQIGFETTGLALRARLAVQRGDIVEELKVRRRLAGRDGDERLPDSALLLYADCLERAWQFRDAARVRAALNGREGAGDGWLTGVCTIMEGDGWVIEPDIPLDQVIGAASVLGRPLAGKWVLFRSEPVRLPDGPLGAETLVRKYDEVLRGSDVEGLPPARSCELWWISRSSTAKLEAILFDTEDTDFLRFVLFLDTIGQRQNALFCLILDADGCSGGWEEHNRALLEALGPLAAARPESLWPGRLRRALTQALRRLHTMAASGW